MGSKFNEIFSDRSQGKPSTMLSARSTVSSFDDIPFNQHAAFLSGLGDPTELDETKIKRAEIEERIKLEKEKIIEFKLQIANHRKQLLLIEKEEMRMDNKLEAIIQGIWSRERKLIHNFQFLHSCEQRMEEKNDERRKRMDRMQKRTREKLKYAQAHKSSADSHSEE